MSCNNCGNNNCVGGCDPANIRIPIGPTGPIGPMGIQGNPGLDGVDGIGITSTSYNATTGELTLIYSDGSTFTTGDLRGQQGPPGNPSAGIGTDVYNSINNTYPTYAEFVDTELAQWKSLITPMGSIQACSLPTSNFDANGYGLDKTATGGSNLLGWAICDGSTYTRSVSGPSPTITSPDLRGRFLVGHNASDSDFSLGNTGGAKDHTHNNIKLIASNLPDHVHDVGSLTTDPHTHGLENLETDSDGRHRHNMYVHNDSGKGDKVESTEPSNDYTQMAADSMSFAGEHTHRITGTLDEADVTINGNTGNPTGLTGQAFDTTTATNINLEANSLPPYYSLIYIIKI